MDLDIQSTNNSGLLLYVYSLVMAAPFAVATTVSLAPLLIVIATRLLSGRASEKSSSNDAKKVWSLPYWLPVIGHGFQFFWDPIKLMSEARNQSSHGIFALNIGTKTINVISDPALVNNLLQQKESAVQFDSIAWKILMKFFGIPRSSKSKYDTHWEKFTALYELLMEEPHLSNMLKTTIDTLQENIPQMISFIGSEIDLQPWERYAKASYVSGLETEINLMALTRDMMGHAALPSMFGRGLLGKYPNILHDVYEMDAGLMYFVMGLPPWTPWPAVNRAHRARQRVWRAMDEFQRVLDANSEGKPFDPTWGDLDDVGEFIMKRHAIFKEHGFKIKERGDVAILWALIVNSNLLVYWLLFHILNTPSLADRIRIEIAPYIQVTKPVSIGSFSEAPKLTLSHEGLAKKCPLFKAAYFEALRVGSQPSSMRQVGSQDITISFTQASNAPSFVLEKGEYIAIPHDLHMRDPKYFKNPERFEPERFLVHGEDGELSTNMATIRPYGGGQTICKGRVFAERECLALVAGILMFWDIEPANKNVGFVIPEQKKTSGVSLPVQDTRVKIKRRNFEWDS